MTPGPLLLICSSVQGLVSFKHDVVRNLSVSVDFTTHKQYPIRLGGFSSSTGTAVRHVFSEKWMKNTKNESISACLPKTTPRHLSFCAFGAYFTVTLFVRNIPRSSIDVPSSRFHTLSVFWIRSFINFQFINIYSLQTSQFNTE